MYSNQPIIELLPSIPIGHVIWNDFEQYKNDIIQSCLEDEKANHIDSGIATSIKNNLWESGFNFLGSKPKLKPLLDWLQITTNDFVNTICQKTHKLQILESWAHVSRPGGFHGPHRHGEYTYSGIFYVDADDIDSGPTVFFNPFTMPSGDGYEWYSEQFVVNFIPGKLIIFPSTLLHYAKPYLGKDKRIVIAFNSYVYNKELISRYK